MGNSNSMNNTRINPIAYPAYQSNDIYHDNEAINDMNMSIDATPSDISSHHDIPPLLSSNAPTDSQIFRNSDNESLESLEKAFDKRKDLISRLNDLQKSNDTLFRDLTSTENKYKIELQEIENSHHKVLQDLRNDLEMKSQRDIRETQEKLQANLQRVIVDLYTVSLPESKLMLIEDMHMHSIIKVERDWETIRSRISVQYDDKLSRLLEISHQENNKVTQRLQQQLDEEYQSTHKKKVKTD